MAFGRGVEQVLLDIGLADPVYLYIVERRHRFYMGYIERILKAAAGADRPGPLRRRFRHAARPADLPSHLRPAFCAKKKEFFDLVHSYGAKVSHHCCGSSRALIPRFIACGMDALQTIQPQAAGMNPYELKAEFAGRIALHGAVDVQGWLQRATPAEIEREVNRLMDEVGRGGGYILAPCHHIQPDTPLENVLAVYGTVAKRHNLKR